MAALAPRELKIGTIIDKTLGVVERTARPAIIFVLLLTIVTGGLAYFTVAMIAPTQQLVIWLVNLLVSVIASYLMLDAMLRDTGLRSRGGEAVFFPYLILVVLSTLGVITGFILFIIPGLLVMARWSIAPSLVVARGERATKALGESWEQTRGHEFSIIIAALALLVVFIAITIACSVMFEREDIIRIVVSQLAASVMSLLQLAMGVALYGLITAGSKDVAQTFQ